MLLAVLVLVESGGAARAFSGALIHCCCGDHSAARPCDCNACPLKHRAVHEREGDHVEHGTPCDGGGREQMLILVVTALTPPAIALAVPRAVRTPSLSPPAMPPDRCTDAERPPP